MLQTPGLGITRYSQTDFPPSIDDDGDGRYSGGTPRSDKSEDQQLMSKHRTAGGRRGVLQVGEMPQLTVLSRISNVSHRKSVLQLSQIPVLEPKHNITVCSSHSTSMCLLRHTE